MLTKKKPIFTIDEDFSDLTTAQKPPVNTPKKRVRDRITIKMKLFERNNN